MVALRSHDADQFIAQHTGGIAVWLFFGVDDGLIEERIEATIARLVDGSLNPPQVIKLGSGTADYSELSEEWFSLGLFNDKKILRLDLTLKDVTEEVRQCLGAPNPNCALILKGGPLRRDSAIRTLCERHKYAVAAECNTDSSLEVRAFVETETKRANLAISPEALDLLVASLGADRKLSRSELDKLITFVDGRNSITLDDVETVISDASPRHGDLAVGAAFRGDVTATTLDISKIGADLAGYTGAVSTALRLGLTLHRATAEVESGGSIMGVIERMQRNSGSLRRLVPDSLAAFSTDSLLASINALQKSSSKSRWEPRLAEMLITRALWGIAYRSKRK